MTVYYVGPSSAGAADGSSWANRFGTLNDAENVPVAAGDTVYVGPGVYRELLTVDVSGSGGSPITYIGDITGEHTDGVGGIVRITGSNNDQTATRANCITATSKNYRTFRGFLFDGSSNHAVDLITSCSNWIIEDCAFQGWLAAVLAANVSLAGTGTNNTLRRCMVFTAGSSRGFIFTHSSTVDNAGHLVENCVMIGGANINAVRSDRVGGITVRNCFMTGWVNAVRVGTALTAAQTVTVNNCLISGNNIALQATTVGEIVENYNAVVGNATDRTNVSTGANTNAYPPLLNPLQLLSGFQLPQFAPFSLSEWSQIKALTGSGTATDDLYGLTRPATASKLSWGPVQYVDAKRETSTVQAGSTSLKVADAGLIRVRRVPVTNVSTTISAYVRWETDYAGTKPRMTIKQPGQSDRTTTATGSSGAWEQLTDTFTPAALPPYVDVFIESSNTATSGSYAAYVDTLAVS